METNQEFNVSENFKKTSEQNEDSDQIIVSDEKEVEEEEGMEMEKEGIISDEDSADEELEELVEKAFSCNSRLQQLLQMNEIYKSSNNIFNPNINSGAVRDEDSIDLKLLHCSECVFTAQNSSEFDRHRKTHAMSAKASHTTSKAFEKLAKDLFKCSECEEWFTTDNKLRVHISKAHNKSLLNCIKCEFSTRDPKQFVRHSEQHLSRRSASSEHKRCHTTDEDCLLQCSVCSHKYNCRTRYEKHVKSHDVSNRFHCQHCEQSFDKEVGLEVHLNKDHKNGCKPFVCDICGQQFYANEKLLNHLSNKHKMAVFGCVSCDYKTNSKYKMNRHQLIHSSDRYKCDIMGCYQVFETKYNLTIHKKNKHIIGSNLKSNSDSNNSLLRSNSDSMDSFQSSKSDKNNGNTSEDNSEFIPVTDFLEINLNSGDTKDNIIQLNDSSCAEDNDPVEKWSESEGNLSGNPILSQILQQNLSFRKNSKNFSVVYNKNKNSLLINQICGKTNVRTIENSIQSQRSVAEEVNDDIEEEESEQKYCTFAGCQTFHSDGKALRDHILAVHKLIKCNKCEKCFQSFSGLYKHKRRYHRSQRQIVCRFCDKKFFYQTSYEKHIETHDQSSQKGRQLGKWQQNVMKTYSCYDCNELFAEKDKYLKHLSKYHSIPAFECDLCDYKSMNKKLLASHMVRHSTAKPFRCDISGCGLSFKSKNSLQIHKRVKHQNQSQRFVCQWPECGKQFSIKQLFDYHQSDHNRSDKPDVCDLIDGNFKPVMANNLKIYEQRHEKQIKCLISGCDEVFSERYDLSQHMSLKHSITIEPILSDQSSVQRRFIGEEPNDSTHEWTNNSDICQSFVESNLISIDGQNYLKQEPNDENSEDMNTDPNNGMDSMDTSSECKSDFNLITHLMRKNYETVDSVNDYEKNKVFGSNGRNSGHWEQNNNDSQSYDSNRSQNLQCFECNHSFGSYDMLYRHNNEFHNKYKPKYK